MFLVVISHQQHLQQQHLYIMMLLLEVISHQQHLQQQHLDIYDVVVGGHFPPTTPPTTTFIYLCIVYILVYQFVSSIGFYLVGNLSTWFETFPPGLKPSHPDGNLPTRVETFPPGWKPSHPDGNLPTREETFPPGLKPFHPGGNLSTREETFHLGGNLIWLETFPPGLKPFHLGIYSIQQVFTLYNEYLLCA